LPNLHKQDYSDISIDKMLNMLTDEAKRIYQGMKTWRFGGIDIGTSGCKCTLFNNEGKQIAVSYRAYEATRNMGQHEIDVFCSPGSGKSCF